MGTDNLPLGTDDVCVTTMTLLISGILYNLLPVTFDLWVVLSPGGVLSSAAVSAAQVTAIFGRFVVKRDFQMIRAGLFKGNCYI